jgi:hypothetical protein
MSVNETNELNQEQQAPSPEEEAFIMNGFQLVQGTLKEQFPDYEVDGQIGRHQLHGPMMAYTLTKEEKSYTCGFFLSELIRQFQSNPHAIMWLSSFFVDMLDSSESKPLPIPPQTEDEAKELFDKHIISQCVQSVRETFDPEPVHVDLALNPEHGAVLEASFASILEGNNTCAIPLHYLLTLYLMNRDPADSIIQALVHMKSIQEAVPE